MTKTSVRSPRAALHISQWRSLICGFLLSIWLTHTHTHAMVLIGSHTFQRCSQAGGKRSKLSGRRKVQRFLFFFAALVSLGFLPSSSSCLRRSLAHIPVKKKNKFKPIQKLSSRSCSWSSVLGGISIPDLPVNTTGQMMRERLSEARGNEQVPQFPQPQI